jgi:hypothetical protein
MPLPDKTNQALSLIKWDVASGRRSCGRISTFELFSLEAFVIYYIHVDIFRETWTGTVCTVEKIILITQWQCNNACSKTVLIVSWFRPWSFSPPFCIFVNIVHLKVLTHMARETYIPGVTQGQCLKKKILGQFS